MKAMKRVLCFVVALAVMLTTVSSAAEAKARTYKTKTVKVTEGKAKTVKAKKKIRKVKKCSKNKKFTVYLERDLSYRTTNKFSVWDTDPGKTQAVKVTYTDGSTQKYKIKTAPKPRKALPSYGKKVVNELKPLLADPDNGLKTIIADWKSQKEKEGYRLAYVTLWKTNPCKGSYYDESDVLKDDTIDEILSNYSDSEKKMFVISAYCQTRMAYSINRDNNCTIKNGTKVISNSDYKALYNGTFKGVCWNGAVMAAALADELGMKACAVKCMEINHGWCCIYVTDKDGKSYWAGVPATSTADSMKASMKPKNMVADITKKQYLKYGYDKYDHLKFNARR